MSYSEEQVLAQAALERRELGDIVTEAMLRAYAALLRQQSTSPPDIGSKLAGGWVDEAIESDADTLQRLGDDAAKWATEFRATAMRLGYSDMDEDWLIGWFANAIEHSSDVCRWRKEATLAQNAQGEDGTVKVDLVDVVWKALDKVSCPGIYMQIAAEAIHAAHPSPLYLHAEIEAMARDAATHRAIERAAKDLPEGYVISVYVENGSAWIDLTGTDGDPVSIDAEDRTLAEQISEAVEAAMHDSARDEVAR